MNTTDFNFKESHRFDAIFSAYAIRTHSRPSLRQYYGKGSGDQPYAKSSREPVFPYGDKYSGGLGTYTAKHTPLAIYSSQAEKTFFVYGGTTGPDQRHLLCMISYYDHKTNQVPRPVVVHDKQGVNDPHDNPSLAIDASGHLWVFVSGRGRGRPGFKYRSTSPLSIDGKTLKIPLVDVDNPARVIDYAAQGLNVYLKDMAFDRLGHPVLLYVTILGHEPGPPNDPRHFRITRWDGSNWQTSTICQTDHNYDMGSLDLRGAEGHSWTVRIPTAPGPQPWQGGGEIVLWESRDDGTSWNQVRQVTHNSRRNHNYVRQPLDAHDPFFVFWADGDPTKFGQSCLYFSDSTGEQVRRLPYDMTSEFAQPESITTKMQN